MWTPRPVVRTAVAALTAAAFVAGVTAAGLWIVKNRAPGDRPADQGGADATCQGPAVEPTYLPWLRPAERVPPPQIQTDEERNIAVWFADLERAWDGAYVTLSADSEEPEGLESVEVRGRTGYLTWVGDPGVGELALRWREAEGSCGTYHLALGTQGLSETRAEREVVRIADSLGRPESPGEEGFALWPADTPEEARAADTHLYNEPEDLVIAFSGDILGWGDSRVNVAEPGHGGATAYSVERGDGPVALVVVDQRLEGAWSVVSVSPLEPELGVDPPMSVEIREDAAIVWFERLGAATVEVRIGYGTEEERRAEAGPGVRKVGIDLMGVDRIRPGHLLVLFRDAEGRVFAALGSPLPPGAYSVG